MNRLTIPDDYLQAIGRLTIDWTYIEYYVDRALCVIAEMKTYDGLSIFTHVHFETKLTTLKNLVERKVSDAGLKTEWSEVVKEINRLKPKRNLIVHSLWVHEVEVKGPATVDQHTDLTKYPNRVVGRSINAKRKDLKVRRISVSPTTIRNVANDVKNLSRHVNDLTLRTQKACGFPNPDVNSIRAGISCEDVPL